MFRRKRRVRVVTNDEWILAAELETDFGEDRTFTDRLLDEFSSRDRPGEADDADASVLNQRTADFGTESLHGPEQSTRKSRVFQNLTERHCRVRRPLVRLRDDGVPAQQGGKGLPRNPGKRTVERHDRRTDS